MMASSSRNDFDLNEQYGQISLEDEEEGILIGGEDEGEEALFDDRWCLVGKFLAGRTFDFDAMRHMMASLWQLGKGIHGLKTGFMLEKVVRSVGAFDQPLEQVAKPYGIGMRAQMKKKNYLTGAQWLRTGKEDGGADGGGSVSKQKRDVGGDSILPRIMEIDRIYSGVNCDPMNFGKNKGIMGGKEGVANGKDAMGVKQLWLEGRSGGITLLWRVEKEVKVLEFGSMFIDVLICGNERGDWRLTGMHGEPNRSLRKKTWDLMNELNNKMNLPWYIIGDLNNVTSQGDKRGGNPYPNWLVGGFNEALAECSLHDLELCGYPYTWEKSRGTVDWVEVRIDRALVNQAWLDFFPFAKLYNLEISMSDHCPIHLVTNNNMVLMEWGKDYSGNFAKRVKDCKLEVKRWKKGRDAISVENYKLASGKLVEVLLQKELFWKQRSKQPWLCEASAADICGVMQSIPAAISNDHNLQLLEPVMEDEIRRALFQMHPDKSSGPDGMTSDFYQKSWNIVGGDIIKLVQNFFVSGSFPRDLNKTNIVLIPKKKQPQVMNDLGPISLCNVVYKIISKVLAIRIKQVLPFVISDNQSSFIPGRLISDNITIAFEIMHYLKRKRSGKEGYMALKLDMISYNVTHGAFTMGPINPSKGNQVDVVVDAAMISGSIWKTRNELLWQKKNRAALDVVKSARSVLATWKITNFESPHAYFATGDVTNSNIWAKPDHDTAKVNVDGAIFKAQQKFGFGWVARNSKWYSY
uniref:Reverse transcriptase domain-containing protein n=1 Tax=Cannabis sativa TaxID=3483 RepID=A0A803QEA0_CANSA